MLCILWFEEAIITYPAKRGERTQHAENRALDFGLKLRQQRLLNETSARLVCRGASW